MIVEAVGIAVNCPDPVRKTAMEEAMLKAVQKAQADGIKDNDKIRELILKARDDVTSSSK